VGLLVVLFILGLCVGSFLNVVIWRVPRGGSVVQPPSQCPHCEMQLGARDLVPVASWLVLRGGCRGCGARISVRYPVVELITALLFVAVGLRFGLTPALVPFLVFTALAVALAGIDIDTLTLPRQLIYGGALTGAVLLTMSAVIDGEPGRLIGAAVGAAVAFVILFVLHEISPRAMGFGDVRFAALIGLHLGWLGMAQVPAALVLAFVLGAVAGVGWLVVRQQGRSTAIPFGPFLAAGAIVTVLWGQPLVHAWLG
jgi:leader peptidase (prepilin peptidase) / N-methyltransferase